MKYKKIRLCFLAALIISLSWSCEKNNNKSPVRILLLSGQNNHEWSKTTPLLSDVYNNSKLFTVSITEHPDTLNYDSFRKFDVIVSNRNTWPDNNVRLTPDWEAGFMRYMNEGGSAVFIHAGASSFYKWDDYHKIGIGRWGRETSHGKPQKGKVCELSQDHPVTTGFRDFYITDELWKKTDIHPDAKAIASISWTEEESGEQFTEKAVFTSRYGKGRSFYTILGHDERALLNSGLKSILVRGTLWAAGKEKMPELIEELNIASGAENDFSWEKTDSSFCLKNGKYPVWQFNFNNRYGRPYFHPVSASGSILTCVDPPDHPWHLGLWFCWKYINGLNYWEYLDDFKSERTGYKSEGFTEIKDIRLNNNADFTAEIDMDISYYPIEGEPVLSEKSMINISAPADDGSFYIDYDNLYTAVADEVILDRTPVQTEPGGRTWGGYAGLSVRFSQDFTDPFVIAPNDSADYKKNKWVYMGFITLSGGTAGVSIIQNPGFTTTNTSWYIIRTPAIPFFYYSPAVLYDGKITLKKGDQLHLKYRVWIMPGKTGMEELDSKYVEYLNRKLP
jgi:type 1 glutamine amidotransferase